MRYFSLVMIVLLSLVAIGAGTVMAANLTPLGFKDLDTAFTMPTVKPLGYKDLDTAFTMPTVKPLGFKDYNAAFSMPTIKRSSP